MEVLRDKMDVEIRSAGITLNGTIYRGIEEVNSRNVNILLSISRNVCPREYLLFNDITLRKQVTKGCEQQKGGGRT